MNFDEIVYWAHSLQNRKKKLDDYETIIVEWLKEHSNLSAAQVEDWLLEEYPRFEVGSSTVQSYITELRDHYALPKQRQARQ